MARLITKASSSVWVPVSIFMISVMALLLFSTISTGMPAPQEAEDGRPPIRERRPRQLYPPNHYDLSVEGGSILFRYWFKDFRGMDHAIGCQMRLETTEKLRRELGVEICPQPLPQLSSDYVCWKDKEGFRFYWQRKMRFDYLEEIGLHAEGEREAATWSLNYSPFVSQASPALADCTRSFRETIGLNTEASMAFLLSMPALESGVPEVDEDFGKWIGGFRVPTSVMLQNEGDCDSKAALFCALQDASKVRMVIFRSVPLPNGIDPIKHALVGIDADGPPPSVQERFPSLWEEGCIKPGTYDENQPLVFGPRGRKYVTIEVAGPGRTEMGEVAPLEGYTQCKPDGCCPFVAIPVTL